MKQQDNKEGLAEEMRLNKFVAQSGICSRREAALLIKAGKIEVNGAILKEPGYLTKATDVVKYKGEKLSVTNKLVYLLVNKPKNTLTSMKDEKGRPTIADLVAKVTDERVFPVDKLERNTTGLLLLTNDGQLTKKLSGANANVKKIYHLSLDKSVTNDHIKKMGKGVLVNDKRLKVDIASHIMNAPLRDIMVEISSIKSSDLKGIIEELGYQILKIDRIRYAGLTKKNLGRGRIRPLTSKEIIFLKHFNPG